MTDEQNILSADSAPPANGPPGVATRTCRECGSAFVGPRKAVFCAAECRTTFINRRSQRGAVLYDIYMAHRFERTAAGKARLLSVMNRLASDWRREDREQRAGRKSWGDWRRYIEKNPHLYALRFFLGTGAKPKS